MGDANLNCFNDFNNFNDFKDNFDNPYILESSKIP